MDQEQKTISTDWLSDLFDGESRGMSDTVAVAVMSIAAIGLGSALFVQAGGFVDNIEEKPKADVLVDPGQDEIRIVIDSVENADDINVSVNGNETYAHADNPDSLRAIPDSTLTLDDGSSGVDIQTIDSGAWAGGQVASGTVITVTAAVAPNRTRVVHEFTQP